MTAQDIFAIGLALGSAGLTGIGVILWWVFRRFINRIDKFNSRIDRIERVLWKVVHRQDAMLLNQGGHPVLDDDDISEDLDSPLDH